MGLSGSPLPGPCARCPRRPVRRMEAAGGGGALSGRRGSAWVVQADGLFSAHTALCFLGISRKVGGGTGTKYVEQQSSHMGRLWARSLHTLKITLETPAQSVATSLKPTPPLPKGIQLARKINTCNLGRILKCPVVFLASFLFYLRDSRKK